MKDPREMRPEGYAAPTRYDIPGSEAQCIDIINAFNANFHMGCVIKYAIRYCNTGEVTDLKKLRHYALFELTRREATDT